MDHLSIPISDALQTKQFYEHVLVPMGWACSGWHPGVFVGFKKDGSPALYFNVSREVACVHLAFKAQTQQQVVAFHQRALSAGAADNGGPGPRRDYGTKYFAAFVLDPDGHNIEAVIGGVG